MNVIYHTNLDMQIKPSVQDALIIALYVKSQVMTQKDVV